MNRYKFTSDEPINRPKKVMMYGIEMDEITDEQEEQIRQALEIPESMLPNGLPMSMVSQIS